MFFESALTMFCTHGNETPQLKLNMTFYCMALLCISSAKQILFLFHNNFSLCIYENGFVKFSNIIAWLRIQPLPMFLTKSHF